MKITFQEGKSEIPLIKFHMPGKKRMHTAIIDTGSDITLIHKDMIGQYKIPVIRDGEMNVNGLASKTKNKASLVDVTIAVPGDEGFTEIKTQAISADFTFLSRTMSLQYNEPIVIDMLIGSNLLNDINAHIDYKTRTLTIN